MSVDRIRELESEIAELKTKHFDVTVLIPTFNGSNTIQTVLTNGLFNQGVHPRVIIMDNGSTDGTFQMLQEAIKNKFYGQMHVELHRTARVSQDARLNKCDIRSKLAKMVDTSYTFWLDDDILLPPYTMQLMVTESMSKPKLGMMCVQYQTFSPHLAVGASIMPTEICKKLEWKIENNLPCECQSIEKQIKKMGYDVMYWRRNTARDLSLV